MAMTYSSFVSDLAGMGVYNADDADFLAEVPRAITYAEKRLYRDLQLLATNTINVVDQNWGALPADTSMFSASVRACASRPSTHHA